MCWGIILGLLANKHLFLGGESFWMFDLQPDLKPGLKPAITPWKINILNTEMEVWKIIFPVHWVIFRFHVNFLGCNLLGNVSVLFGSATMTTVLALRIKPETVDLGSEFVLK